MAPFWPFKKKESVVEIDEQPPAPIVYKRGEDPNARGGIATDTGAYKDALALFGDGSSEVQAATDQSVHYDGVTAPTPSASETTTPHDEAANTAGEVQKAEAVETAEAEQEEVSFTWVHHTDGYHYKQNADGSFEPTPHVQNADGTYDPYS